MVEGVGEEWKLQEDVGGRRKRKRRKARLKGKLGASRCVNSVLSNLFTHLYIRKVALAGV